MLTSFLAVAALACVPAGAQTAQVNSGTKTLVSSDTSSGQIAHQGIVVDGSGNIYVTDLVQYTVTKIPAGCSSYSCATTNNSYGVSGPIGIAVDGSGNLYVADTGNNAVKKIPAGCASSSCTVTLGSGFNSPIDVRLDASGNIYVADLGGNAVKKIAAGCTSSSCTVTKLIDDYNQPVGIAVDSSGNVYVADYNGNSTPGVTKIPAGCSYPNCTTTTLGSGFVGPVAVAVDGSGNIYVVDYDAGAVKKIPAGCTNSSCTVTTLVTLTNPEAVAVDASGNVYVVQNDGTVVEITNGVNYFSSPVGTASSSLPSTFKFTGAGIIGAPVVLTQGATGLDFANAGTGTCTAGHSYNLNDTCTVNVKFTPMYAGTRNGAVELVNSSGNVIATAYVYGTGTGPQLAFTTPAPISTLGGGFSYAWGVAVDGAGNVYVADTGNSALKEMPAGCSSSSCVTTLGGGFNNLHGVAVDGAGNIYIADYGNSAVKETPAGCSSSSCVTTLGGGFNTPYGVAVDGAGNVYVAEFGNSAVKEMPAGCSSSSCVTTLGGGFNSPYGVAVDGGGNVYVADTGNSAVKEIPAGCSSSSCVTTLGGGFSQPYAVAVDGSGSVYVVDYLHNAVKRMPAGCSSSSCVTTLASGFNAPTAVAMDGGGNVYVADKGNNLIKEMDLSTPPSLAFASTIVGTTSSDSPRVVTLANIGNQPLTFPVPGSGSNPSLSTNFTLGNSATCPLIYSTSSAGTLASGATCTLPISFAPQSVGSITGSLVLTDNHLNAAPATQTISLSGTATAASTTTTVSSNLNPADANQSITFTAGISPWPDAGTVTFKDGSTTLCTVTVPSSGSVTCTKSLAAGAHSITATYSGDTNYSTSTSSALSETVNSAVTATQSIVSVSLTQNHAPTAFTPVTGSGGTGTLSYSISPALPAGLSLNTSTGAISGTPTAVKAPTSYTVTVTDQNAQTATANFSLTVNAAVTAGQNIASASLTQNHAATSFMPVTGSGGTGTLSYSISPSLPGGLSFDTSTGTVSGTPTVASAATTYTVTVTDAIGSTATASFLLTVNGPVAATTAIASQSLTYNVAASFTPVTGSGGTGTLIYSISPALPAGLSFNTSTGAISGTPTAVSTATTYTVTVTDVNGSTATAAFSLAVNQAIPTVSWSVPASISYGTALSATQLNATASVPGTFTYNPALGTVLSAGAHTLSATFVPTDTTNYATPATITTNLTVTSVALTVTANNATRAYGAANPTFTGAATGAVNGDTFTVSASTSATSASAVGSYSITPTVTGANLANYTVTTVNGTLTVTNAALTVTANNATRAYGAANPTFTGTVTGAANGDSFTVSASTSATSASAIGSYPITPTVTGANLANYTVTTVNGTLTITNAALTVTANNATRAYGAANPTFTGTVTGAVNGDSFTASYSTTATASSSAGTYSIVPTVTGANLSAYTVSAINGTLTVTKAAATVGLSASATSVISGQPITLTASVASATTGTPTGTVSLYDGSTLLGTSTLSSGQATLTTTALGVGAHTITATYSGDGNFNTATASTGAAVTVVSPDFTLSGTGTAGGTQTVIPGGTATFSFTLTPSSGAFPAPVSFSVAGLPSGATATFSPSSLPSGSTGGLIQLTIQTPKPATASLRRIPGGVALALLLFPLLGTRHMRRFGRTGLLALLLLGGGVVGLTGCGTSSGLFAQPAQDYTITVTVTSGTVQHTVNYTLNVQ